MGDGAMLEPIISIRFALQEIIPLFISCKIQAVRGERANHILLQLCELIEDREAV